MTKDDTPILVTLDQIMADYDGALDTFMTDQPDAQNILIHWLVSVDVKGQGQQTFRLAWRCVLQSFWPKKPKINLRKLQNQAQGLFLPIFLPGSTARKTLESLLNRHLLARFLPIL